MNNQTNANRRYFPGKPISYYPALDETFDGWAEGCSWEPEALRQASEHAIRTRHHEATIKHEAHKARGNQPDVFALSLGSTDVFYTVEPAHVMIRGYHWEIDGEPLDDRDGGGFYEDPSWMSEAERSMWKQATERHAKSLAAPQEVVAAIRDVLDYLWEDERRNFEETAAGSRSGHIFESLHRIKQWLDHHPAEDGCNGE
jgi:hypothetical protein